MAQITLNSSGVASSGSLLLQTNGTTTQATVDTSGNLGLGVTPSAWGTNRKAMQLGSGSSVVGRSDNATITYVGANAYYNGTNNIYLTSGVASLYAQDTGGHNWYTAASGTAGNTITFTQAMTLDASGNFMVGATSANGRARFVAAASADCILNLETSTNNYASGVVLTALNDNGAIYNYILSKTNGGTEHWKIGGVGASSALAFSTGGSERARIDSSGNLLVGVTGTTSGAKFVTKGNGSTGATYNIYTTNSSSAVIFATEDGGVIYTGTLAGSPYNNTTASAANMFVTSGGVLQRSTSSLKYKKNVQNSQHGLAEVLQLRSVTYEGKSETDDGKTFGGLIAEEVHEAGLTEFVQYAEDGSPDALAYGNMVSLCIKAIQEQQAIITQLQADVAALKG